MKIALIIAVVLVLALVLVIASRPAHFRVTRSVTMSAPPQKIFDQVNDFRRWDAWSPWAKLDPNATQTVGGGDAGVGAWMSWSGNNKVGEGKITIQESKPGEEVRLKLEFLRPMKAVNDTVFTFEPQGDVTRVAWTMAGTNNFMGKAFGLVVDCDKMVGTDFEKGLAAIKAIVETPDAPALPDRSPTLSQNQ